MIGQVGQNVGLPIWLASAPSGGSIDTYFVLLYTCILFTLVFFIGSVVQYMLGHFTIDELKSKHLTREILCEYFLVGFFTAFNGLFLVFAAPSDRCPVFLQSALTNTMIPLVIVIRIIILKKIPSLIQCLCAVGVLAGLFATSIPTIFDLDPTASQESGAKGVWRVLWPLIFAFSFVPAAIYTVLEEKYLQKDGSSNNNNNNNNSHGGGSGGYYRTSSLRRTTIYDSENPVPMSVFLTLVSMFQTCTFLFLFWYDLLPTIGFSHSMKGLVDNFWQSLKYTYMLDGASIWCVFGCWIFVFMYCITSYGQSLLLRYTEGAIYSSMVNAMVTPIGEVFWMLFHSATDFKWDPVWNSTSIYPLIGLVVIVPCVFIYNVYGSDDAGGSGDDDASQDFDSRNSSVQGGKNVSINKSVNMDIGSAGAALYGYNSDAGGAGGGGMKAPLMHSLMPAKVSGGDEANMSLTTPRR